MSVCRHMKTKFVTLMLVIGLAPLLGCQQTDRDGDSHHASTALSGDGFVSMFDGESLSGWSEMLSHGENAWSVRDGVIVGEGDKGRGYLTYARGDIADFEMKFHYRFPGEGNSGVNLRARPDPTGMRDFQSYHVDIGHVGIGKQVLGAWDFHTPGRTEHACFRGDRLVIDENDQPTLTPIEGAVTLEDIHQGGWNEVHVVVQGNRFWFSINGKPSAEFVEHLPQEKRLDRGMIQLQLHDPGMIVEYRDLWLKILD